MEKRKRILYVITKANWGGAQKYVYDLALAASDAGHEVAVAVGGKGGLTEKLSAAGIRVVAIGGLVRDVRIASDASAFTALRALLARERPDVVHLNSSKAAGLGALAARLARVPRIIYTAHGWAWNESRPAWQKLLIRILAGSTVYLAHETICVSEAIRRDIAWLPFARRRLVVITHGIECQPLIPREEARVQLMPQTQKKMWIGMIGELHKTKCVADAIAAFARIASAHQEAVLVALGEGEERAKLEALVDERGLGGRVFLLGFVADSARYMSAFDIFLHTSQSEALGYVILEAGCARLPVVATNVGGIPEIVENGVSGLLVPAHSPAKVADALEELLANPTRAELLGARLHARVVRGFSLEHMLRQTLALYA